MQNTKKILSMLLVLAMVLGLLPASVFATEAEEAVVYLSISFDSEYIDDINGDPIAYVPVSLEDIAAVDLTAYGLENMCFDADGDGSCEITALQLLIYAHEELYGGDWSDVNFSAAPGSSYFAGGIFGFTENLVYFHNGDFPVDETQTSEWYTVGATSDRIVLEAGDFLDVASFSCYGFLWDQLGGFHLFADENDSYTHDYTANAGETLSVKLKHSFCDLMYGVAWVNDAADYEIFYGSVFGEAEGSAVTDESGCAQITFPDAGTYYVWCEGGNGSDDGTHGGCDYYWETDMPCIVSSPAFAKVTVNGEADKVTVGDREFTSLEAAFAYQAECGGEYVSLREDMTVKDLVLPENAALDLNGHTLTADRFDAIAPGAQIVDTTGGEGLLTVKGECVFEESNPQLPIKDETAGGFRFFKVNVESVAVTGKTTASPKYWFRVQFENFEKVCGLIDAGSDFEIKMLISVDGVEAEAVADRDFLLKWAQAYKADNGIYITEKILDTEGKTVVAMPAIGANGVRITGDTL